MSSDLRFEEIKMTQKKPYRFSDTAFWISQSVIGVSFRHPVVDHA